MKARVKVVITGLVQGVFFRAETQRKAKMLDISGYVRNMPDGTVEAVFEGNLENVKQVIDYCKVGPPGAKVENVEVHWQKYSGQFDGFRILY